MGGKWTSSKLRLSLMIWLDILTSWPKCTTKTMSMRMEKCPHFSRCSQNFCPLDPELYIRTGKKQDLCRFMREAKRVKVQGREFVSGGTVMPDTPLNSVPRSNLTRLNTSSQMRRNELDGKNHNEY